MDAAGDGAGADEAAGAGVAPGFAAGAGVASGFAAATFVGVRGALRKQVLDEVQLALRSLIAAIELKRLVVGSARHLRVDVAEILVRGGVARMRSDRGLEGVLRLVVGAWDAYSTARLL